MLPRLPTLRFVVPCAYAGNPTAGSFRIRGMNQDNLFYPIDIAETGLALDQELTAAEIHATIHAHPTMSEVIHEATLAAEGHAIHF